MERTMGLAYEIGGAGEPVVLIHAGVCADFFAPLTSDLVRHGYRVLRYHRPGYGASDEGSLEVEQQAAQCHALMRRLGIERAHLVGHSSSAAIAVELALASPDTVGSLALLEMALLTVPSGDFAGAAIAHHRAGDARSAVDTWLSGVGGPDYRAALDAALPDAFERAVVDADTFFTRELPALRDWSFTPARAGRVTQPVLVVLGEHSHMVGSAFGLRHDLLLSWLPHAEPYVLPGATHLLHVQNPHAMATALADFLSRHPISTR